MANSFAHGSSAEARFAELAKSRDWKVSRAGWPDFLITAEGKSEFVEVKSALDRLSDGQVEMFSALENAGIEVKVWWENKPDELLGWRAFLAETSNRRPPPKLSPLPPRRKPVRYNPKIHRGRG